MAAPNIVEVASIIGKSAGFALTTSALALVNNPASSGKVLRVVSLYISNVDGVNAANVTVNVYSQDDIGGTPYALASVITVPAKSTLVLVEGSPVYLEEDRSLGALASDVGDLVAHVSWEEIS